MERETENKKIIEIKYNMLHTYLAVTAVESHLEWEISRRCSLTTKLLIECLIDYLIM